MSCLISQCWHFTCMFHSKMNWFITGSFLLITLRNVRTQPLIQRLTNCSYLHFTMKTRRRHAPYFSHISFFISADVSYNAPMCYFPHQNNNNSCSYILFNRIHLRSSTIKTQFISLVSTVLWHSECYECSYDKSRNALLWQFDFNGKFNFAIKHTQLALETVFNLTPAWSRKVPWIQPDPLCFQFSIA